MNILKQIVENKKAEIAYHKSMFPLEHLLEPLFINRETISFKDAVKTSPHGIIAEFKRKSPSKGWINRDACINNIIEGYTYYNVAAISVLTDPDFFGGSLNDLKQARRISDKPLLRKDFIIDEYQILQAKAFGADCILLIAAILDTKTLKRFTRLAHSIGLEVLLEIHSYNELETLECNPDMVGINNRDLTTFEVSTETSTRLIKDIPENLTRISESGINSVEIIKMLRKSGFDGFLMGEQFMKNDTPEESLKGLIDEISLKLNEI
ncbi:MAG: indole-3-glycerol phosphate synthase TrpC [Bacteroidales bacterium]